MDREIRVRLQGRRPHPSAKLAVTAPFAISDATTGKILDERAGATSAQPVRPAPGGGVEIGGQVIPCGDVFITPRRDAAIVLAGQTYRGRLRIRRVDKGLLFTNYLEVESYLRGVLRGELPRHFHPQSFRAQAVAARSYVLYQKSISPAGRSYDVVDGEGSQMYIGVRGEDRIAVKAVEDTRGEVCVWDDSGADRLFCTYYASACGGRTQRVTNFKPNDPDVPPLAGGVLCSDCYWAPFYRWKPVRLSKTEVTRRLVSHYPSLKVLGLVTALRPKATTADGRIIRMELIGSGGQAGTLVGEDFRLSIGGRILKSTNFTVEDQGDHFLFRDGKGYGHGVGLCQHGMETKARRGMDYRRILARYYPGSVVKTIYH